MKQDANSNAESPVSVVGAFKTDTLQDSHTLCTSAHLISGSWQKVRQPCDKRQRRSKVVLSRDAFT